VDRRCRPVDEPAFVPRGVTRAPSDLWEPGDATGKGNGPLTCGDEPSSTIHKPYCYHYFG
jgi:hypothetical protein